MEQTFSQGVSFSGITLAVTAPEGDSIPKLLEEYLMKLSDVRQYCSIVALDRTQALTALQEGEVTAVVVLPESFVRSVQSGENPSIDIIVDGARPIESLLTLWVGQSASDLLASVQAGIYVVADLYDAAPPEDLSRSKMLTDINFSYILWTLNRSEIFEEMPLLPTNSLPIATHYALCLLAFFALAIAPLFSWNFQGKWLAVQRRLGYVRRSPLCGFLATVTSCALVVMLPLWAGLVVCAQLSVYSALWVALLWSMLAAVFAAFCALITSTASGCGGVSFLVTLAALFVAGGIVPPVLLPEALQRAAIVSPVSWMSATAALALECSVDEVAPAVLAAAIVLLGAVSALLYARRVRERSDD